MFMFLFLFVFLVLLVSILKNSFVLFCFCVVVFVTRLSGLLVCILWSFFLFCFLLFCFEFVFFLFFFIPLKKDPPQNRGQEKNPKSKNAEKKDKINQLAQLCSQIVLFNFWGPLQGGFSYTSWRWGWGSAVNFSKESVPPLCKNQSSKIGSPLRNRVPLQLPMGWGVDEELTESWPTIEQLCVQNLALTISCCCSPTKSLLARSWPRVGHGLPTFDMNISVLKVNRGLSCRGPLATPNLYRVESGSPLWSWVLTRFESWPWPESRSRSGWNLGPDSVPDLIRTWFHLLLTLGTEVGHVWNSGTLTTPPPHTLTCLGADFRDSGDATKHLSVKRRGFQWKGRRDSVNVRFGKDFYRKGNSVKRSWAIQWTAGLWKLVLFFQTPGTNLKGLVSGFGSFLGQRPAKKTGAKRNLAGHLRIWIVTIPWTCPVCSWKCPQRLPKGTSNDNSHEAKQNVMHILLRLCSF